LARGPTIPSCGCFAVAIAWSRTTAAAPRTISREPHASLGVARLCSGDRSAARQALERSLALDPAQPKIRQYLREAGGKE
jgi:Flp pilus assembly protein TadD